MKNLFSIFNAKNVLNSIVLLSFFSVFIGFANAGPGGTVAPVLSPNEITLTSPSFNCGNTTPTFTSNVVIVTNPDFPTAGNVGSCTQVEYKWVYAYDANYPTFTDINPTYSTANINYPGTTFSQNVYIMRLAKVSCTLPTTNGAESGSNLVYLTVSGSFSVSTSTTPLSCYNGSNATATATALGGTTPYTYSWNTSPVKTTATVTGLSAGGYIVTATDHNGCTTTASASITNPIVISPTAIVTTPISCFGGNASVLVSATGGATPYTSGTGTFSAPSGTYTFTVTDNNGCTVSSSIPISQPAQITLEGTRANGTAG